MKRILGILMFFNCIICNAFAGENIISCSKTYINLEQMNFSDKNIYVNIDD